MPLTLADRIEIQDLMARFGYAVDVLGPDAMHDIFTEDATFLIEKLQIDLKTRDGIIAWMKEGAHTLPPNLMHVFSNIVIDGDGDEATVNCISQTIQAGETVQTLIIGRYSDGLVKTPQGWRIQAHRLDF